MDRQGFIKVIAPLAKVAQKKFQLFASVTTAQAILETGCTLTPHGNNLFGVKWQEGCGYDFQLLNTKECYTKAQFDKLVSSKTWYQLIKQDGDNYWVYIKAKFRAYKTLQDSINDHAKFVSTPRYAPVRTAKNWMEACNQLQRCGYATDPEYAKKLTSLITQYKLDQYDK